MHPVDRHRHRNSTHTESHNDFHTAGILSDDDKLPRNAAHCLFQAISGIGPWPPMRPTTQRHEFAMRRKNGRAVVGAFQDNSNQQDLLGSAPAA